MTNLDIGWRKPSLLCSFVILCLVNRIAGEIFDDTPDSAPRGRVYDLTKLNVYPDGSTYKYQARCSLPCSGSYQPDTLYVTINLDRIADDFTAYSMFEASQSISSSIWWIRNSNWINENNGFCVFDFQFDYYPRNPEPTGTCQMGWNISAECLTSDATGAIIESQACPDIAANNRTLCYQHNIYAKCCHSCSTRADVSPGDDPYCPYGDRNAASCSSITQADCYDIDFTCCGSCDHFEENIPGCRYGNRGAASFCDYIVTSDCYNLTTEFDCCHECYSVADDTEPDCIYGDRKLWCSNIDRRECYTSSTEDLCCQTCEYFESDVNDDCRYGDKQDCSDITKYDCENNKTTRNRCCETCPYLIENDCYGDLDTVNCPSIEPFSCYDNDTRLTCCMTCLGLYDLTLGEDCLYGDRLPAQCDDVTNTMCYNDNMETDCCLQCSYLERDDLPDGCRYGNKDSTCGTIAPATCYQPTTEDRCCETCHWYNNTEEFGFECRYGDRIDSCYSRDINSCYDDNARRTCCRFCSIMENPNDPDCPYGDKLDMCTTTLTPSMCYNYEEDCCQSCDYMVKPHLGSNCTYGDRRNCSTISPSSCYLSSVASDCCETCYYLQNTNITGCSFGDSSDCSNLAPWQCYNREQECCDSCQQYLRLNPVTDECKYGDRASWCANISPAECYTSNTEYTCCETCHRYRREELPYNCRYGDLRSVCNSGTGHSSLCYNVTIQDQCCESCLSIQTNDPTCLYGDKAPFCDDIEARDCYISATESTCCNTCPDYYGPNYPQGCEYGDTINNCRLSSCDNYGTNKLSDCCYTCRSYLTTTPPPTTATEKSEKSTGEYPRTSTRTMPSTIKEVFTTTKVIRSSRDISSTIPTPYWTDVTASSSVTNDISTTTRTTETSSGARRSTQTIFGNTGAIVGGIVGGVVVIVVIVAVAFYCIRMRNKSQRSDYKRSNFNGSDASGPSQFSLISGNSVQHNPNGHVSYNNKDKYNNQPARPPPKRQDSTDEVYDYINPDDVKSVVSMPITRRPTLPDRKDENPYEPYQEPVQSEDREKTGYDNLALHDKTNENNAYHQYFVLEKEQGQRL